MASPFGKSEWLRREAERLVHISFNRIIDEVNKRREKVLSNLRDIQDTIPRFMRSINELEVEIAEIENGRGLRENLLHETKESTIKDFKKRIEDFHMQACLADFDYQFVFDDTELKRALSTLGAFEKSPRHYSEKEFAKSGFEYELKCTGRFSVNEELGLIAVNNRNEKKICYFDLNKGKYISSFKLESYPVCAIEIIDKQEIALSVFHSKSIMTVQNNPRDKTPAKSLSEMKGKLEAVTSICYDKQSDRIYAVSSTKHSLYILNRELSDHKILSLPCRFPQSIRITVKEIFILDCGNPCLHILSKDETILFLRSIIPRGSDLIIDNPSCFAVDKDGSIIIPIRNKMNIFSSSGQLLRSFPVNQNLDTISQSIGVFVTQNYEIILLTDAPKFPIQIF